MEEWKIELLILKTMVLPGKEKSKPDLWALLLSGFQSNVFKSFFSKHMKTRDCELKVTYFVLLLSKGKE